MSITSLEHKYLENIDVSSYELSYLDASRKGNICFMRWLYHYDYKFILSKYSTYSFYLACVNNHLEVAKFILEKEKNIDISEYIDNLFTILFEKGFLDIIIWLYDMFPNDFYMLDLNLLFIESFHKKYVKLLKWIVSIDSNIKINMNNDNLFIESCRENNIELAKMCLELRPNAYYLSIIDDKICHFEVTNSLVIKNKVEVSKINSFSSSCLICYENNSNIITKCNHRYCYLCLENHYNINDNRCPYCRTENDENELFLIENSV